MIEKLSTTEVLRNCPHVNVRRFRQRSLEVVERLEETVLELLSIARVVPYDEEIDHVRGAVCAVVSRVRCHDICFIPGIGRTVAIVVSEVSSSTGGCENYGSERDQSHETLL
jgi:hypothetical protein